jgi:hypothetical protein
MAQTNTPPIIASCLVLMFIIPTISAAGPDDNQRVTDLVSVPDINVTNTSLTNRTIPYEYRITPEPIKFQIELNETLLPAPKGEMALGPRTIGFSIAPASLAILIIAVCVAVTGAWFFIKKKRDEDKEE